MAFYILGTTSPTFAELVAAVMSGAADWTHFIAAAIIVALIVGFVRRFVSVGR
jgi:hypothetical protein